MGFAEDGNGSLRSNRALDDRRHKRLDKVLNAFRGFSDKKVPISKSDKKLNEAELHEFREEMKDEKRKADLKKLLALILSLAALLLTVYLFGLIF